MESNINIFTNKDILIEKLALKFLETIGDDKNFYVALAGGTTPKLFYEYLAKKIRKNKYKWNHIHLFWGDERCVPPTHHESNFGMVKVALLDHLSIPKSNIHRILGENDPVKEVFRYSEEIQTVIPRNNANKPCFDWIFLGLGEDGHTASIFPDSEKAKTTHKPVALSRHPQTGQQRITLSLATINLARRVTFVVTGLNKANIVSSILSHSGENFDPHAPAAMIAPKNGLLEWYLDAEAAANL
jgi:6-phosphogluconolactonase